MIVEIQCKGCGDVFVPKTSSQLYCNHKCKQKYDNKRHYAKYVGYKTPKNVECKGCNTTFLKTRKDSVYCCELCKKRHQYRQLSKEDKATMLKDKSWKHIKRRYGITIEDYNRMFDEQEGQCKICKTHQSELRHSLHIDHDHNTGRVRGLLCENCNRGIGIFGDDTERLKSAIQYLEDNRN